MKNFEKNIAGLIKKNVQFKNKSAMRQKLLMNITHKCELEGIIKSSLNSVSLEQNKKVHIKSKLLIFAGITNGINLSLRSILNFVFRKELVATFSLVMFFVGFVLQPFSSIESVKAYAPPKITTYSGAVTIERNGELIRAYNDFTLEENDIVQTGPAGFAEIVFADNSLVRLSTTTRVRLRNIDNRFINSKTEISLHSGDLWVNTLGLTGSEAKFLVHAGDLSVSSSPGAVFDFKAAEEYVRVVALSESVNLSLLNDGVYIPTTLNKGNLVKVRQETKYSTYLDQLDFQNRLYDFNLDWIISNYNQDQFYIDTLSKSRISELEKIAGITPDSYFYPVKQFRRAARLAMTFDPVRQAKLELMYANQKMVEAEVLFERGKNDTAKRTLNSSSDSLKRVAHRVSNLNSTDNFRVEEISRLKDEVVDSIELQKKTMVDVLPVDSNQIVRNNVNEAEKLLASNPTDLRSIELKQLNNLLFEAKSLSEHNKVLAEEKLAEYLEALVALSDELELLVEAEQETVILSLIDSNIETINRLAEFRVSQDSELEETNSDESGTVVSGTEESSFEEVDNGTVVNLSELILDIEAVSKQNLERAFELADKIRNPSFQIELRRLNTIINSSIEDLVSRPDIMIDEIDISQFSDKSIEVQN